MHFFFSRFFLSTKDILDADFCLNITGTNEPVPGVFICADGDPEHRHFISYYYTTTLTTEVILLALAIYRSYVSQRYGTGGKMIKALAADSVKYFVAIFCVYSVNQAIWLINDVSRFSFSWTWRLMCLLTYRSR